MPYLSTNAPSALAASHKIITNKASVMVITTRFQTCTLQGYRMSSSHLGVLHLCYSACTFHTPQVITSTEQSPSWEANRSSAKKFIFHGTRRFIVAFTRARYLFLSWTRSIQYMPPSHVLMIPFNIILPSTTRCHKSSLSHRFPHQSPILTFRFPHTCYMPCLSHPSWSDHPNNTSGGVQTIKLFLMQPSPLPG
jgi:hypothetical protein